MKRIVGVIGTRPEAIKMAPVFLEIRRRSVFQLVICATGQHPDMLRHALSAFDLVPDVVLKVPQHDPGLAALTSGLMRSLDDCFADVRPDVVLVHGDTQSSLAGALVAFWRRLPTGHVEAGLRTKSRHIPFPEELNRRLVDQVVDWHFAPTPKARENLLHAGVCEDGIVVTGNTAVDAILLAQKAVNAASPRYVDFDPGVLDARRVVLVTGHRRENHGAHLRSLCSALLDVVRDDPRVSVVYPVHLNPNVAEVVYGTLANLDRVHLIPPQPYLAFVDLMCRSTVIVSDSGGIQEEAPSLGKPVLVTRESTERPEMLATGLVHIVGNSRETIKSRVLSQLHNGSLHPVPVNPCGDGLAAPRIVDFLENVLGSMTR